MRLLLLVISFHCVFSSLHAQQSFHARVVDAETGEALPFVNVYQASGKGCVTNLEGDFTISAGAEDSLRFSFVVQDLQVEGRRDARGGEDAAVCTVHRGCDGALR